jgi:hypothetical protein
MWAHLALMTLIKGADASLILNGSEKKLISVHREMLSAGRKSLIDEYGISTSYSRNENGGRLG